MGKSRKKPTAGIRSKQSDPEIDISDDNDMGDEIDNFYTERDENLRTALAKTTKKPSKNKKSVSWALNDDSDEANGRDEVLAFDDDESSMGSDAEDDDNDYQQISGVADDDDDENGEGLDEDLNGSWGTTRKMFYNEDVNANDEDAKLEEQEAVQIQRKYYDMLEKSDFGLDLFQSKPSTALASDRQLDDQTSHRHVILPDNLLQLSSNERLQLIRDQAPELEPLCKEFKNIFDDIKIYLLPFVQLVIDTSSLEEFHSYPGWQFVLSILELYLTYCSYLSLYLMMKSNDLNMSKHPIINDIEQYRKLCQLIDEDFQSMKPDLLKLCESLQEKKTNANQSSTLVQKVQVAKPRLIMSSGIELPSKSTNGSSSAKPSLRERMMKRREGQTKVEHDLKSEQEEEEKPQKRRITYEIEKNKGLTIKRKKENRNPRVRHRNKYQRALTKRKSRVPTARTEEERYVGEPTGIRAGIKRGIKLKS
ncbi:unnamed protein product [Adineta ricciae]|uniref:Sas10 C-terminal domain-containing protein n=1 Tax=Adineta ricciae TaxID=249248 RepID=A0A814IGH5_ADIRI|nr:unnamed protein product [Adineta ricciae]CAF1023141.1 unnamed protein product [Adineta ricciae]